MDDRYALRPGIVLHGRYEIKELLGIGGSAYVYQALDRLTGIKTAVKEYFPSGYVTRDADGRSCRLNSMNTVVPFDDGRQYFFRRVLCWRCWENAGSFRCSMTHLKRITLLTM